ncbi:HNH endonuclease signature motif containing protein [Mesorhizobium sp. M0220]|uniref:HNH endonuclease signature motif containing protein n=1 Tax=unclassified Mesorhizobium TaxID=325217 RepID=UPI003334FE63
MNSLRDELTKGLIWQKAAPLSRFSSEEWRSDAFGTLIRFADYGDRKSPHGWEIDHIKAVALGGTDDLDNLRPLHFRTNATLGGLLGQGLNAMNSTTRLGTVGLDGGGPGNSLLRS